MLHYLKNILVIIIILTGTWFPTVTNAQETVLFWKNGDSLPGKLLDSKSGKIRWASDYFSDELVLDVNVLDSIVFPNKEKPTPNAEIKKQSVSDSGTFRVGTVAGDIWTADIIDSDENTLLFSNKRYGQFRVKREAIYMLENQEHTNLIFDGSQLSAWQSTNRRSSVPNPVNEENVLNRLRRDDDSNEHAGWHAERGGHPYTNKAKTSIFKSLSWPKHFEIDLELASTTRPPGFVFSLGKNLYEALRLETWVNELVVVQGTLFEPVLTIKPNRRSFRLRLTYNQDTNTLKVFDLNGNLLLKLEEVQPTVETAGLYIYNRGGDLTVQRLRVYKRSADAKEQKVDFSKSRVHMMNGEIHPGKLFVEKNQAYVLDTDGTRRNIEIKQVDRVVQPGRKLTTVDGYRALTYIDGTAIQGQIVQLNPESIVLQTAFSDEPITCSLNGAAHLRLNAKTKTKAPAKDYDKMFFPSGSLRGHVIFNNADASTVGAGSPHPHDGHAQNAVTIQWQPIGSAKPVRFANTLSPRIERHNKHISRLQPFDVKMFPHLMHLKNGEVIPCQILTYDETSVNFRSPFIKSTRLDTKHIKGIEFSREKTHARKENRNPITITGGDKHRIILEDGRILNADLNRTKDGGLRITIKTDKGDHLDALEGAMVVVGREFAENDAVALKRGVELLFDPLETQPKKLDVKLERALTVPRFNRDNPPNHIIEANNGDLKRGKLISINEHTIRFDSKLRKLSMPIDLITRVVDISAEHGQGEQKEVTGQDRPTAEQSEVRFTLIHNPVLIFEPVEVKGDTLFGRSPIYGEVSIPLNGIQYLHLGEKARSFKSVFEQWIVRPAKELDFGANR